MWDTEIGSQMDRQTEPSSSSKGATPPLFSLLLPPFLSSFRHVPCCCSCVSCCCLMNAQKYPLSTSPASWLFCRTGRRMQSAQGRRRGGRQSPQGMHVQQNHRQVPKKRASKKCQIITETRCPLLMSPCSCKGVSFPILNPLPCVCVWGKAIMQSPKGTAAHSPCRPTMFINNRELPGWEGMSPGVG